MTDTAGAGLRRIQAPTRGRVVLFNARDHVAGRDGDEQFQYTVPAVIHGVVAGDRVRLWAVDVEGSPFTDAGELVVARFGEVSPGIPMPNYWCYPALSSELLEVGAPEPGLDIDALVEDASGASPPGSMLAGSLTEARNIARGEADSEEEPTFVP